MTIELVSGTVVLGRISMFSGVNVHEAWSGSPAQESVTNIGLAREAAFSGVMETTTDPVWPAVSVREAGATETWKLGVPELACA
jgi:hypothetical protein